jgi:RecA-family ATPase
MLDVSLPAIDELAALGPRFVGWRWENRDGKATKPPIAADGRYADSSNPGTWMELGSAMEAAQKHQLDGIGFELDAERDGIVGIDLDGCRYADTGEIKDWATKIIRSLRSYAEVSPSGTGVKIFCRAEPVPKLSVNKRVLGKANGMKAPAVEIYTKGRYFCLTGNILPDVPDEIVDATPELERLVAWVADGKPAGPTLPQPFLDLLEHDVQLSEAWHNGAKIGKGGDTTASGLDFSLARYLRRYLDDSNLEAVLRCYPHGQIGSGKLKGRPADKRIEGIIAEIGPRPQPAETTQEVPPLDRADADRLNWQNYIGISPAPPAFMVENLIPKRAISGLFGTDGLGKTLFGQQALTTMASGIDLFGHKVVERGATLGWFCEEPEQVLAHRQHAINQQLGLTFGDLDSIGLEVRARFGMDNLLVRIINDVAEPTQTFWALRDYCLKQAIKTLWLDHLLHIVAGDITRADVVTKMLAVLAKLSIEIDGAVIVAGHVAKAEGSQYLGSVMFSALVRSRLWLRKPTPEELTGHLAADYADLRMLELAKANHAGLSQVMLQWRAGAFVAADDDSSTEERTQRERHAESVFIRALRELDRRHRSVDIKGAYAAHNIMVEFDLNEELTPSELQAAMKRLLRIRRIKAGIDKPWMKANRVAARGLAFAEDAL